LDFSLGAVGTALNRGTDALSIAKRLAYLPQRVHWFFTNTSSGFSLVPGGDVATVHEPPLLPSPQNISNDSKKCLPT